MRTPAFTIDICAADSVSGQPEAFPVQTGSQCNDMIGITRLNDAMHRNGTDILISKSAIMSDVDDTGAFVGDESGKSGQTAGAIADGRGEAAEPAVRRQASLDDATKHVQINIATAQ